LCSLHSLHLFIFLSTLLQKYKNKFTDPEHSVDIFSACVVGGCAWQFGGLSCEFDILFPSDNHFSQGMEREDLYFYGQSDEYGDNFLSSLLDNPPPPQQ
jgi:hypothetical protein